VQAITASYLRALEYCAIARTPYIQHFENSSGSFSLEVRVPQKWQLSIITESYLKALKQCAIASAPYIQQFEHSSSSFSLSMELFFPAERSGHKQASYT
jgi:hypothetical protein